MELQEAFDHLYNTYFGELQHEREEIENLPNLLHGCEVFIDVGASLGMFTYYASKALDNAHIIAVEGDPDRYAELKNNSAKWQENSSNRIDAVEAVVGEAAGAVTFYKTGSQISGGFFPVEERSDRYQPIEVKQITLDDLYESGKKTLVKIDVEGGEYRVMQGAKRHLQERHTEFLMEIHWWGDRERGTSALELLRFLRSQQLSIQKTVRVHTSNYLLRPAADGENVLAGYVRCAPLLLAKSVYGKFAPKRLRQLRESLLNRQRRRRFGKPKRIIPE